MTYRTLATGLLAFAFAISEARADDADDKSNKSAFALGFIPGIRAGGVWAGVSDAKGATAGQSGWGLELDGTALVVFPGDIFAIGLTAGFTDAYLKSDNGAKGGDLSYSGLNLSPALMVGLGRFGLAARVGYMVTWLQPGTASVTADSIRFGGSASFVFLRNYGGDVAVTVDVFRTQASSVDFGTYKGDFGATTAMLGFTFSFDANALTL